MGREDEILGAINCLRSDFKELKEDLRGNTDRGIEGLISAQKRLSADVAELKIKIKPEINGFWGIVYKYDKIIKIIKFAGGAGGILTIIHYWFKHF